MHFYVICLLNKYFIFGLFLLTKVIVRRKVVSSLVMDSINMILVCWLAFLLLQSLYRPFMITFLRVTMVLYEIGEWVFVRCDTL